MQPARRARVRLAAFVILAALTVASTGTALAADRSGVQSAGRPAWDRRTDDAVRLVVTFRDNASRSDAQAFEGSAVSLVTFERGARRAIYQTTRTALRSEKRRLERDPSVRTVQVSHRLYRAVDPEDEQFWDALWGLHNTGQTIEAFAGIANVDVDGRESLGVSTGTGVVIAVIDDGVDFSQPDLAGQAWVNPGESGGGKETNNVDDDANGYIDDVNGWDFCHDDKTLHDPGDDFHGTHVSGTIAAKLDGAGIVGLAPGVKVMALKFLGDDPACGWDDQAIAAIEYAKSFGVRISNNSWARPASSPPFGDPADDVPLYEAIEDSGMLFVAAAGNSGQDLDSVSRPSIPASFDLPNILSVAAVDNTGQLASFSNYGETSVDVSAPGVSIASLIPEYGGNEAGYYYLDGTSMAAPHVSAIAAVVGSQTPSILTTPTDLKKRILDTAKNVGDTGGMTLTGRVASAAAAIDHTDPTASAPNSYSFVTGIAIGSAISTRVRWPAGTDDLSGVASYALRQSVNGAGWTTVTASTIGPVRRPLAHVLDRLPLPGACARPGRQHRRICRRSPGPLEADPAERDGGDVRRHVDHRELLVGVRWQHALRNEVRGVGPVQLHRTRRCGDRTEERRPRRREGLRRRVLRRDHQRLPQFVAVQDRAVRAELGHVGQPQGQARPHRHGRPSTLRHRRVRLPAVAGVSCPGRSSWRRAPAAAGRGSCGPCR